MDIDVVGDVYVRMAQQPGEDFDVDSLVITLTLFYWIAIIIKTNKLDVEDIIMTKKKIIIRTVIIVLLVLISIVNVNLQKIRDQKTTYVPAEYEKYTTTNDNGTICEASVRGLIPLAEERYGTAVLGHYFLAILDDMTIGAVYVGWSSYSDYEGMIVEMSDLSELQSKEARIIRGKIIDLPQIPGSPMDYFTSDNGVDYDAYREDTDSLNKSLQNIKALSVGVKYLDTVPVYPDIPVLPKDVQDIIIILLIICLVITGFDVIKARQRR